MRLQHFLLSLSSVMMLSACSGSTSPATVSDKETMMLNMAHSSEKVGDRASAESLYMQAVQQRPHSLQARMELAGFYQRAHAENSAETMYEKILNDYPDNLDVKRALANAYITDNKPDKALIILNALLAKNPDNALLYNSQGAALDMKGQYSVAQASYDKALQLDPKSGVTFKTNLSMSYILSKHYDQAIATLLPLLSAPDVTPNVRQNLALAYGLKGDMKNAKHYSSQDLSDKEIAENIRFYRMLADKDNVHAHKGKPATANAVNIMELFPEENSASNSQVTKASPKSPETANTIAQKPAVNEIVSVPVTKVTVDTLPAPVAKNTIPARKNVDENVSVAKPEKSLAVEKSSIVPVVHETAPPFVLPVPVLRPDNLGE